MLVVTVYDELKGEGQEYHDVDYVSLISDESYGPPALIAPTRSADLGARATVGQLVMYINTKFVPMFSIERESD